MKSFAATRPQPDGVLAVAVLRSAAVAVGVGAIIWTAGVATTWAVWVPEDWQSLVTSWNEGFWVFHRQFGELILMLTLMCWTFAGLGASLALARPWLVYWGGAILRFNPRSTLRGQSAPSSRTPVIITVVSANARLALSYSPGRRRQRYQCHDSPIDSKWRART